VDTSVERTQGSGKSSTAIRRRKRRSPEEKLRIVRETLQSHESVAVIARRHGVNANQVFAWRRRYQRDHLGVGPREPAILPVHIAESPLVPEPVHTHRNDAVETSPVPRSGPRIEIELAEGPRVKIWDISSETLRALIRDLIRPC
jgi:transposase-like protein